MPSSPASMMELFFLSTSPAVALRRSKSEMMLDMAVSSTDLFAAPRSCFSCYLRPVVLLPVLMSLAARGSRVECRPVTALFFFFAAGPATPKSLFCPCVEKGRFAISALPIVNRTLEEWSSMRLTPLISVGFT